MDPLELVDDLYDEFVTGLGGDLAPHARDLPRTLRLSLAKDTPWSGVFQHEITLAAPALLSEALPGASILTVREAVRAHLFAVVGAFGTDRIEDGQVSLPADALHVLDGIRAERDAAIGRLRAAHRGIDVDPARLDRDLAEAMVREREHLGRDAGVDFAAYESVSLAKQSAGVVPSCMLAEAVGSSPARRRAIQATLESVALALQMHDDVVDWEDDEARGGSWAVALMRKTAPVSLEDTQGRPLRAQLLASGVLLGMLRRSRWHMRAAAARARALGASRVAAWASARTERLAALVDAEARSAGYAIRSHALSAWASEVLA